MNSTMTAPEQLPSPPRWTLDAFRMGVWAALPVLPGIAAFAMAFGIVAARNGLSLGDALLMTGTVYAGLTQMIVVESWPAQITVPAGVGIVAITFLVNLRYLLIGTTLRPLLHTSPSYKVYPTLFLLGEPNWLLSLRYYANGGRDPSFLLGTCVIMWFVWVLSTIPGYWLGAHAGDPRRFGLDMVMPVFFVAMLVPMWKGPRRSVSWIIGAATAIVVYLLFGGYWYVVAGALAGCLAGAFGDD
jgi:predicted branched-subunit amino acid permease